MAVQKVPVSPAANFTPKGSAQIREKIEKISPQNEKTTSGAYSNARPYRLGPGYKSDNWSSIGDDCEPYR